MAESIQPVDTNDTIRGRAHAEDMEDYRIYSISEIVYILQEIMRKCVLVTLYFNNSNRFILTSILDVDKNRILIERSIDQTLNKLVLESKQLTFFISLDGIKIEFVCDQISTAQFEEHAAFLVSLPESLIRLQRRKDYRIATSTINPLKCMIPTSTEENSLKAEVNLIDISCGGIGVIDHQPAINLEPGVVYENCQIDLPGQGCIDVTIEIKSTYEVILKNGQPSRRAGCQFIDLPVAVETQIQRYVIKKEQEKSAS